MLWMNVYYTFIKLYIYKLYLQIHIYKAHMNIRQTASTYMQECNPKNKYQLQGIGIPNTIYLFHTDEYLYIFT